jgi:hypothetical protein
MIRLFLLVLLLVFINSCLPSDDDHREDGKVFHASIPGSGAIGGLYFGLYNDHTYQICSTGGIGQDCYEGQFTLNQDTLVLMNLSKYIYLKSNRMLISRYPSEQNGSFGEVTQLDSLNHKILGTNEIHFLIRMDSLTKLP